MLWTSAQKNEADIYMCVNQAKRYMHGGIVELASLMIERKEKI